MKKYLLCLLAFLASFSLTAQAAGEEGNTVTLGYCNGQAASDATKLAELSDAGMIETYGGEFLEGAADACEKLLKK